MLEKHGRALYYTFPQPLENLEQGSLAHGCTVAAGSAPGSGSEVVWFLQVVGAKVVTNARSPGARCYGFVTMSTAEEATKCISHLHKTELHGKMISVEKVGGLLCCSGTRGGASA